jgi:hypothetical protein
MCPKQIFFKKTFRGLKIFLLSAKLYYLIGNFTAEKSIVTKLTLFKWFWALLPQKRLLAFYLATLQSFSKF